MRPFSNKTLASDGKHSKTRPPQDELDDADAEELEEPSSLELELRTFLSHIDGNSMN